MNLEGLFPTYPPASRPSEVRTPRCPVVLLPAVADTGEILVHDVDVNKLDSATILLGQEREDQGRVQVRGTPVRRTPRLDDETLRNDLKDHARENIVERAEWSASVSRDRDRRACECSVLHGIEIHVEKAIRWSG